MIYKPLNIVEGFFFVNINRIIPPHDFTPNKGVLLTLNSNPFKVRTGYQINNFIKLNATKIK